MPNPQLAPLLQQALSYPKPVDQDELEALVELITPQIKQMAAIVQAGSEQEMVENLTQIQATLSAPASPLSVPNYATRRLEMALAAKVALSNALVAVPGCTNAQRTLMIDTLSKATDETAPKFAPGTEFPNPNVGRPANRGLIEIINALRLFDKPADDVEMDALLELSKPLFNELGAFLVDLPPNFLPAGVRNARIGLAQFDSPFSIPTGSDGAHLDMAMKAKTLLAQCVATQPHCTFQQRSAAINALSSRETGVLPENPKQWDQQRKPGM